MDSEDKPFTFASDLVKQLITLATGVLTASVLLSKDLRGNLYLALASWIVFLLSVLCGVGALMSLTAELRPMNVPQNHRPNIWARNIRLFLGAQIVLFLVAVALVIAFGFTATRR